MRIIYRLYSTFPVFMEKKEIIKNVGESKKQFAKKLLEINPYDCLIVLHSLIEAFDNERGSILREIVGGSKPSMYLGAFSNNFQQLMTLLKVLDIVLKTRNDVKREIDTVPIMETVLVTGEELDEDSEKIINHRYDLSKVRVFAQNTGLYGGSIKARRHYVILNPTNEISEAVDRTLWVVDSFYKWHFFNTALIQKAELGEDSSGNMIVENKTPEDILGSLKISSRSVLSEAAFFPQWKPEVIEKTKQTAKTSEQNRSSPLHKSDLFQEFDATMNEYHKFPEIKTQFQKEMGFTLEEYQKIWKELQIIAYQNNEKTVVHLPKSRIIVKIKKKSDISKKTIMRFLQRFTWNSDYSFVERPIIQDGINLLYSWVTIEYAPLIPLNEIYHHYVNNDLKGKEFEEDCRSIFRDLGVQVCNSRVVLYGEVIPFEESLSLWQRVKKKTDLDVIGVHKKILFVLECKARKSKTKKKTRFANLFEKYHKELYFKAQWIATNFEEFKEITKKLGFEIPEEVKYVVPLFISNMIEERSELLTNNISELKYILENTPEEFDEDVWKLEMNRTDFKIPLLRIK